MLGIQESMESRLTGLEHTLYDVHARFQRSEDNSQFLHVRNQIVMEALGRSLQVRFQPHDVLLMGRTDIKQLNHEMSRVMLSLAPNPDATLHRDSKSHLYNSHDTC